MARVYNDVCDLPHDQQQPATGRHTVAKDGNTVEIDLCDQHQREVSEWFIALASYGRPVGAPTTRSRAVNTDETHARAWARAQGIEVPAHGKVADYIIRAYRAANQGGTSDNPAAPTARSAVARKPARPTARRGRTVADDPARPAAASPRRNQRSDPSK